MKSIEFMYWLQGYFEVCDCEQLQAEQVEKIHNHLKMVEITDGANRYPFCSWLKGFLEAVETPIPSVNQTQKIKNRLNELFDHVVEDKIKQKEYYQYPETPNYPRRVGMGLHSSDTSELIKC